MGEDDIRDDGRDVRLTVAAAAERLGVTKEAVRKRISRGTLRSDKDPDGTVHVYVPVSRTPSGTASGVFDRDELVDLLRAQLEDLRADRDAWRDQARRSDYMASAAMDRTRELESRIRELEAPSEPRESPEKAEEELERAEPHSATGGAQEGTEHPQQQSGWLVPVDKLPWWHYVVGIIAVFLVSFFPPAAIFSATKNRGGYIDTMPMLTRYVILFGAPWAVTGAFGFWVGLRQRITRFWPQIISIGAVVGAVAGLGVIAYFLGVRGLTATQLIDAPIVGILGLYALPAWLLYASGSLIGNAWQRRRIGRISGTTPASPVSRTTQGTGQQPRKDLTPAQQAILGWSGAIISALITLVGTIIAVGSGP